MLCFDKGTNQYFIASDEQVDIVENQMNDILKRMISEGKEIITLSDVMNALGVENLDQSDNDQKERSDCKMAIVYELVSLEDDHWDTNGGYPVPDHLGYYSSEEKAEEAWIRYKEKHPRQVTDVKSPINDRIGYDIYPITADDQDEF